MAAAVSFAQEAASTDYTVSPLGDGGESKDRYFDRLGVPNLYVDTVCRKNCRSHCCYEVLKNASGSVMRSFSSDDDVEEVARNRYEGRSFLLYRRTYSTGNGTTTRYRLLDDRLHDYALPSHVDFAEGVAAVTKTADIVQLTPDGLFRNGKKLLDPIAYESAQLVNNPEGDVCAGIIAEGSREIFVGNLRQWVDSGIRLAAYSDKEDVFSIYPKDADNVYVVAYNLVNVLNKGLIAAHVDIAAGKVESGWLYNSETQNVGFSPEIYLRDGALYVYAIDSTHERPVHLTVTKKRFEAIDDEAPKDRVEGENFFEFAGGVGVSYLAWYADSAVEKDDDTYADADYDISDTLYKELYFQGRVLNTRLAVSYLRNEAEKKGGLTKKASELLRFLVDFDGLISKSAALRIAFTKGAVNGVTTFIDKHGGHGAITPDGEMKEFTSELTRFSVLVMQERGFYWGGEYSRYETPSAVGFTDSSKTIAAYGLDPKLQLSNYILLAGYDTASYARRYEADYGKFFFQGFFGGGISVYDLSGDFKTHAKNVTGKTIKSDTWSLVFDAQLQAGYLWQSRFKRLRGFGYAIDVGVKARGTYTGIAQSEESHLDADEIQMQMSRYDIWYGPYVMAHLLF